MPYLEDPKNPGEDDGRCALCSTKGLTEEDRCHGCGYLVCDAHFGDPWGQHLVAEHDDEDGVWKKEQTPDEGEEEYVGVGLVNPRHVELLELRAESLKEPAKEGSEDQARLEIAERLRNVLLRVSEEDVADLEETAQQIENSRALRKELEE